MTLNDRERRTLTALCTALLPEDSSAWASTVPTRVMGYLELLTARERRQVRLGLRLLESPLVGLMAGGMRSRRSCTTQPPAISPSTKATKIWIA